MRTDAAIRMAVHRNTMPQKIAPTRVRGSTMSVGPVPSMSAFQNVAFGDHVPRPDTPDGAQCSSMIARASRQGRGGRTHGPGIPVGGWSSRDYYQSLRTRGRPRSWRILEHYTSAWGVRTCPGCYSFGADVAPILVKQPRRTRAVTPGVGWSPLWRRLRQTRRGDRASIALEAEAATPSSARPWTE